MKPIVIKIGLFIFCIFVVGMYISNYMSYKKLQCLDHNTKGFALRSISADATVRAKQLIDAKQEAIQKSDYSILFGCRIYENGKLTKFTYDYPMTDDAFYSDYDSTIKLIEQTKKTGGIAAKIIF